MPDKGFPTPKPNVCLSHLSAGAGRAFRTAAVWASICRGNSRVAWEGTCWRAARDRAWAVFLCLKSQLLKGHDERPNFCH
jgi:hypothetical protein